MTVKENLESVRRRIEKAAAAAGRDAGSIRLIAAAKNVAAELVEEAILAGVTEIGENRVQEAIPKIEALRPKNPQVRWHMIGHLQRNKVRQALDIFDIIQSVDSERLAKEIEARAEGKGKRVPVLVEVNTSAEESKYGVAVGSTIDFLKFLSSFKNISVQGLMTIGPLTEDPEKARPSFVRLRELSEKIRTLGLPNIEMRCLSMGMTDDFEVAVQEGSNMVRIGRAIFGKRRG